MKGEFSLIETYFTPLAKYHPASLNLSDDAALLAPPAGAELVITKDAISAGVHFIGDEPPSLIAKKLLRVNLSDLAAMGATPMLYFLALMLPKDTPENWIKDFAQGLAEDQKEFSIHLAGGDTTATQGGLSLSLTAIGSVPTGKALRRNGAKPGDNVYVSGTLGDAALGLSHKDDSYLRQRYLLPQPQLALGEKLRGIAHACMDISDGLVQDLGHICRASNVSARIERALLPLSPAASRFPEAYEAALSGGDDYELLFTASPEQDITIRALSTELQLPITRIGTVGSGSGVHVVDENGNPVTIASGGYQHF